ncbi:hypothetical protein B0A49_09124 [Cryomyces minteri]|uniref:RNA polymerase II transcription factor B subunit 3 n=1 Tax=Cryomyces minteri TaxID=331657 RepID=A0A4U0WFR1_9PEZI|nr:hypothetical protein B0A49_09124 [Cryomyces minteri]
MSRLAQRSGPPAARREGEEDDVCPVCKSSRYLNPNMRFLVNPECYHRIKNKFRKQTFEDIQVEREVDIRRRVAEVFNRREDDFNSLLDYNNYLNDVEDITYNLINKIDLDESERKLASYASRNQQTISLNVQKSLQESQNREARQVLEKEQARIRREAARREEQEEKRDREEGRRDVINMLASSDGDASRIAREGQQAVLKRSKTRQAAIQKQQQALSSDSSNGAPNGGFFIQGLKTKVEPVDEGPYDPFQGFSDKRKYFVQQNRYAWDRLDRLQKDTNWTAGGYDFREFCSRTLCEAFSGLGVFIGEEVTRTDPAFVGSVATVAAAEAGAGSKDIMMEDPF